MFLLDDSCDKVFILFWGGIVFFYVGSCLLRRVCIRGMLKDEGEGVIFDGSIKCLRCVKVFFMWLKVIEFVSLSLDMCKYIICYIKKKDIYSFNFFGRFIFFDLFMVMIIFLGFIW